MWTNRIKETVAVLAIGDGIIEFLAPGEHSKLWEVGPGGVRDAARFFADNPDYMRILGAAQVGFGLWLALRQYKNR